MFCQSGLKQVSCLEGSSTLLVRTTLPGKGRPGWRDESSPAGSSILRAPVPSAWSQDIMSASQYMKGRACVTSGMGFQIPPDLLGSQHLILERGKQCERDTKDAFPPNEISSGMAPVMLSPQEGQWIVAGSLRRSGWGFVSVVLRISPAQRFCEHSDRNWCCSTSRVQPTVTTEHCASPVNWSAGI